ncbi:MAG: outer membrane beta-barrel protein [Candidatus Chromulinivorax sp.]|nr:outer membrane beta-barrel protein [Candidatus Chromulinivorax sp.]
MKRCLVLFFLLVGVLGTVQSYSQEDYSFYLKVGTGASLSQLANVVALSSPWNEAEQGYDSNLGNCAIVGFGIGCELWDVVDLEVTISNRSIFEYRKFQTATNGDGSYTREFDLSVTPILLTANFLGKGIPHLHWNVGEGCFHPMLGVGLGVSNLLITNFRTTGLALTGDSSPFNSFSAENQYTMRKNFTYAVAVGFEYNYDERWAIGTGYRWLNAGNFDGPEYLRTVNGSAVDVGSYAWQMRFRANEWFVEFKIFI